ncbi:unnamed protein product [Prunus brigantina]
MLHLVGPLPPAPAKKDMMIVATDYFTKWIEAEALSSTKEANVERFIWRNIICRFGLPQSLVTDNGSKFIGKQITAKQSPIRSVLRETQGAPEISQKEVSMLSEGGIQVPIRFLREAG